MPASISLSDDGNGDWDIIDWEKVSVPASDGSDSGDDSDESDIGEPDIFEEHGRLYSKLGDQVFNHPVDQTAIEALDAADSIVRILRNGNPCLFPVPEPKTILGVGLMTCTWAIEAGDKYPDAKVEFDVLIPRTAACDVPRNVMVYLESPDLIWDRRPGIDQIQIKGVECFVCWDSLASGSFSILNPGGRVEICLPPSPATIEHGSDLTIVELWCESLERHRARPPHPDAIISLLSHEGFIEARKEIIWVPLHASSKREKLLSELAMKSMDLEGLFLRLMITDWNWTVEQVAKGTKEYWRYIMDKSEKVMLPYTFISAQKPSDSEASL